MSTAKIIRAGKGLKKFLKPLYVGLHHEENVDYPLKSGSLINILDVRPPAFEKKMASSSTDLPCEALVQQIMQPKEELLSLKEAGSLKSWIDHMMWLVQYCKKTKHFFELRNGMSAYRRHLMNKGSHKLRSKGGIIDLTLASEGLSTAQKENILTIEDQVRLQLGRLLGK